MAYNKSAKAKHDDEKSEKDTDAKKGASEESETETVAGDEPAASAKSPKSTGQVEGDTAEDENAPYKDSAEAKEKMGTETAYGERRADGEIEGVTVNVDQYQGPKYDNLKAEYKSNQEAASQKASTEDADAEVK